jgi:hypothetical protein
LSEDYINNGINKKTANKQTTKYSQTKQKHKKNENKRKKPIENGYLCPKEDERATKL